MPSLTIKCLRCRADISRATGIGTRPPCNGDVSICGSCGHAAIYVIRSHPFDVYLRQATELEQAQIFAMPEVRVILEGLGFS